MKKITLTLICLTTILFYACNNFGRKLEFNKGELYYKDGVSYDEAVSIGEYLQDSIKIFNGEQVSMQIMKRDDRFVLRGVYKAGVEKDTSVVSAAKAMTYYISHDVLHNQPVDFEICNEKFVTLKLVKGDK